MRKILSAAFAVTLALAFMLSMAMVQQQAIIMPPQLAAQTQKAPVTWAKTYGGEGEDIAACAAATPDGGCIVAGKTNSFGAGNYDFWVIKLDSNGTIEWQKAYGGTGEDSAYSVAVVDGGYVVAGYTNSFGAGHYDFWVIKLDSTGGIEWQKTYGGTGIDVAYCVAFDLAGTDRHVVVVGETSGSSGDYDFLVMRLNLTTGNPIWNYTYGGSADDRARSVAFTGNGYVVAGSTKSFGSDQDIWVLRLNMDGSLQWQNVYKNTGDDSAFSVAVASSSYIVAGYTSYPGYGYEFFVLRLDNATGEVQWARKLGKGGDERAYAVASASDGCIVAGLTNSLGAGGYDSLVVKIDQGGTAQLQKTYGGLKYDEAYSVTVHGDGYITVVGTTQSFGAGQCDFWVLRLNGSGAIANPNQDFIITNVMTDPGSIKPEMTPTTISSQLPAVSLSTTNVQPGDTNATVKEQAPPTPEGGGAPPGGVPAEGGVELWIAAALWSLSGAPSQVWPWLIGAIAALAVVDVTALLFWRHKLRARS